MRRIYNFTTFSNLFEADAPATQQSKLYDTTLNQIISAIINNYTAEVPYPVEPYADKVEADIKYVSLAPPERKIERIKEIIERVNQAAKDNKDPEAQEVIQAWVEAANKAVEALESLIEQYQNDPEDLKYIGSVIDSRLEEYLKELEEIEKKEKETAQNSSFNWEGGEMVSEGIFEGKRGMMDDIESQISIVSSKLANLAKNPGMTTEISKFQNEILRISERIGTLRQSKRKDISKDELKRISARLSQIPEEAESVGQKIAKQDTVNKNAATILIQALELASKAYALEQEYQKKKIEAETKIKQEEQKAKEDKVKVKVSDYIEFDPAAAGKVNDDVKNVQQIIIDKFGGLDDIKNLPQYKEFSRFGADGKFGPRTQEMIKIIQRGLDMDPSGNISPDLVYKIQTEDIVNESARYIFKFKEFDYIIESFKIKTAVEYAKNRPSYRSTKSSGGSGKSQVAKSSAGSGSSSEISDKEISENTKKNQEFLKLTAEEKWKWLLNYIKNNPRVSSYREREDDYGNPILSIVWKSSGEDKYTIEDKEVYTWCWKPENNNSLGRYEDYTSTGKDWFIRYQGNWGEQVDPSRTSSNSGNWTDNGKVNIKDVDWDQMKDIAAKIAGATVNASGTSEEIVLEEIKKIKTKEEFRALDKELEDLTGHDFQWIINDEYGVENAEDVKEISDWLNKIGVKTTYKTAGGGRDFWDGTFKTSY